ncbi:hypothetical protein B0H13DRAFT_2659165 [Mycena leptocephala]|nr:hypothetical protein B0H13DRAFT_2659165 [Mycena leptocephala]
MDNLPPGYLFLCPVPEIRAGNRPWVRVPDPPYFWSPNPSGVPRLSPDEAKDLGHPALNSNVFVHGLSWDSSVYAGLRQFHEGKGFDPYSHDIAKRLRLPVYHGSEGLHRSFAYVNERNVSGQDASSNYNELRSFNDKHHILAGDIAMFRNPNDTGLFIPARSWNVIMGAQFSLILILCAFSLYDYFLTS